MLELLIFNLNNIWGCKKGNLKEFLNFQMGFGVVLGLGASKPLG